MTFWHGDAYQEYERREHLRDCVECPTPGTRLSWQGPSLFNNDSLLHTVIERKTHVFKHENPYRPDQREPLPILYNSAGQNGPAQCGPNSGQELELIELLGRGYELPSFVWKCSVVPEGHTVVLKLLIDQNDKLPAKTYLPPSIYEEQADMSKPVLGLTAAMLICQESDNFRMLEPLQGNYVPVSYGFYEFTLPDKHTVLGHVMEYIPTIGILEYFRGVCAPHSDVVDIFLSCLHQAYVELHRCGIVHKDAGLRNLRLLPISEMAVCLHFILLDFTRSSSIAYCESRNYPWQQTEESNLEELYEELGEDLVLPWLDTDRGKLYKDLVRKTPEQLALL